MARSLSYLLVAMLSIQYGASAAKHLFPVAGAAGTAVLRTSFAAILLVLLWRPWRGSLSRESFMAIAGYGIALGLMNLLFYLSLERIPLGIAVTLEFTGPLALALFSSKKILDMVWAVLAGLGIWLILPGSQSPESLDLTGVFLALGAGVMWALYILAGQKAGKDVHSGRATAIGMCFAALAALPMGLAVNFKELANPSIWPIGLVIAIFSSALPYSLEMMAMKNISQKTFGILMSVEPAFATLAGFFFLGEGLSWAQGFGVFFVMLASAGCTLFA
jgi:inner membrane transporter RhtA